MAVKKKVCAVSEYLSSNKVVLFRYILEDVRTLCSLGQISSQLIIESSNVPTSFLKTVCTL